MYGIRIYYLHTASQKMLAKRRKGKEFRFRSEGQERELERRECGRKRKMTQCLLEGGKVYGQSLASGFFTLQKDA